MKSVLSRFLIPFTALALTVVEFHAVGGFSAEAQNVRPASRPKPTPQPTPFGPIKPGDIGGAHRNADVRDREGVGDRAGSVYRTVPSPVFKSKGARRGKATPPSPDRAVDIYNMYEVDNAGVAADMIVDADFFRPCDPPARLQNEFSGIYEGNIDFAGLSFSGRAGLRICGNEFILLLPRGMRARGLIASVRTAGYAAAALRFTALPNIETTHPLSSPKTVSVRVSRTGKRMSLRSVPGEPETFSFIGSELTLR